MKTLRSLNIIKNERDKYDLQKSQIEDTKTSYVKASEKPTLKINMKQSLPQIYQEVAQDQKSPQNIVFDYNSLDVSPEFKKEKPIIRQKRQTEFIQVKHSKRPSQHFQENNQKISNSNINNNQFEYGERRNSLSIVKNDDYQFKNKQTQQEKKNAMPIKLNNLTLQTNANNQKNTNNFYSPQHHNVASFSYQKNIEQADSNKNTQQFHSQHNSNNNYLIQSQITKKSTLHNIEPIAYGSEEFQTLTSQENLNKASASNIGQQTTNKFGKQRILSLRLKVDSPNINRLKTQTMFSSNPKSLNYQVSPTNLSFKKINFLSPNLKPNKFPKQYFFDKKVSDHNENQKSPESENYIGDNFLTAINSFKQQIQSDENNSKNKRKNDQNKKDEEYIEQMMNNSKGLIKHEEECLPGSQNIEDQFRFIHKNIDKIEEKNHFYGQQSTFLVDLVSTLNKIQLPPQKMNYLKDNQNCSVLNINNFQMSARQTGFFTKVISTEPYKNNLTVITANNNNITDTEFVNMIKQLPHRIEVLILKQNFISNLGLIQISEVLKSNHQQLIQLDLENNKIKDLGAKALFKALLQNNSLAKLNLSQNQIGDACSQELKDLLENSMTLQELYLKWNNFRQDGGICIAQGIKKNQSLKVLDISFNNLGSHQSKKLLANEKEIPPTIGKQFAEAFTSNKKLIHLDMSNCNLESQECQLIQEAIKKNTILFGLHFEGNSNYFVDENGFINKDEKIVSDDLDQELFKQVGAPNVFTHSIQGILYTVNPQKKKYRDICWVCEGWEYLQFNYDDNNNKNLKVQSDLFIHFDFDGYKAHKMQKIGTQSYQFYKMCPPNKTIQYFITEPKQMQIILDDHSNKIQLKKAIHLNINYKNALNNNEEEEVVSLEIDQFNVIQTIQQNIFSQEYYLQVESGIRDPDQI
ncbi:hypothetical protein TTHERM_00616480 (macronuclear) [Tetrahymena thermophila SB210]|uniref:Leucine Rich Repeat family protein n=1 Tax=Tetrahymena thermophila (strain SB210) TaxID=312017 RepID=I7MAF3_TETTS|nr:hypothetical protein TTHERM_00616480 [Tetrahymena thermophila SB210]EAS04473.2 hypothetical protein TTHERM_00616480 [Tetrahymena thermophila SB210]|eukprot:XP_001024718.2 hypothetical protein TTHERM_00616480 [Tetrahymena thermophila SB210]